MSHNATSSDRPFSSRGIHQAARRELVLLTAAGMLDEDGNVVTQRAFAKKHKLREKTVSEWKSDDDFEIEVRAAYDRALDTYERKLMKQLVARAEELPARARVALEHIRAVRGKVPPEAAGVVNNYHGATIEDVIRLQREYLARLGGTSTEGGLRDATDKKPS